jgi:hypothetical protein
LNLVEYNTALRITRENRRVSARHDFARALTFQKGRFTAGQPYPCGPIPP